MQNHALIVMMGIQPFNLNKGSSAVMETFSRTIWRPMTVVSVLRLWSTKQMMDWTITKIDWLLGRYEPSSRSTQVLHGAVFYLKVSFFKNGPNPASFCLFSFFSQYNDNCSTNLTINEIKLRWFDWDLNPGQQDGRRRQIHWAMAAPLHLKVSML